MKGKAPVALALLVVGVLAAARIISLPLPPRPNPRQAGRVVRVDQIRLQFTHDGSKPNH